MRRSRSLKLRHIQVTVERRAGKVVGLQVQGHAGFAPAGRDIVCAAASALVLAAARGLRDHSSALPVISDTEDEFRLRIRRPSDAQGQAILETTVSGLEAIARSYVGHLDVALGKIVTRGQRKRPAKGSSHGINHRRRTGLR